MTFAAIFILFPPLYARAFAQAQQFPQFKIESSNAHQAVFILMLDELSFSAAGPLVKKVRDNAFQVKLTEVATPGRDTIKVIPTFFFEDDFSKARPCSSTALCNGASSAYDFAKITNTVPNLNIVGFHHPYCAIQGLRYCFQSFSPYMNSSLVAFGCELARVALRGLPLFCKEEILPAALADSQRLQTEAAILAAPFWQEGGVLYAHVLLPHPPSKLRGANLGEEYRQNLEEAANLVGKISDMLKHRFGNDFRLLITSDHPLRRELWCGLPQYSGPRCETGVGLESDGVPLITVAGDKVYECDISINSDIFRCLGNEEPRANVPILRAKTAK